MFTARTCSIIGACAALCGLAAPAAANAASVYVSHSSPVVPGGKSCTQPNYATIQGAIVALKSVTNPTINVCPGTYTEQLTIGMPLKLSVAGTAGSAYRGACRPGAVDPLGAQERVTRHHRPPSPHGDPTRRLSGARKSPV